MRMRNPVYMYMASTNMLIMNIWFRHGMKAIRTSNEYISDALARFQ